MTEKIPAEIVTALAEASRLHQRTVADYLQCVAFSQMMAAILVDLEEAGCPRAADRVMTVLVACQPREGSHCDKALMVGEKMKKLCRLGDRGNRQL